MKKFIALLMAAMMILSLVACGGAETTTTEEVTTTTTEATTEAPTTPGTILMKSFHDIASADASISLEDLANKILENECVEFMPMVMPADADSWFPGLTENPQGFKSAVVFGPAISTIPFSGFIFELEDGADVDAFIKTLEDTADLGWNVCTRADEMVSGKEGSRVCFILAPKSFEFED